MIAELHIENFKTWKKLDIDFAQVTALFGANSSGKSSVTQFLLLLKQTKEATDRGLALDFNGQYVALGEFKDVVFSHDLKLQIPWSVTVATADNILLQDASTSRIRSLVRAQSFDVSGRVRSSTYGAQANMLSYKIGTYEFSLMPKREDTAFDLKASGGTFKFVRTPGRAWQLPGPIKSYAFPDQARTYFQNASFLADLESAFERQIDSLYYLGPLREFPKRDYTWARTRPIDVGVRGEKVIDAILAATVAGERRNLYWKARLKSFQEIAAHWLKEMGLIYDFSVKEIAKGSNFYQVLVRSRDGGPYVALTDVGFGVSQVLPVIVLLYYVPEGSTVILEQPEIHLHPSAQSVLADLILNVSEHRDIQVIIETHSEHLLLRLQRRVAEKEFDSDNVALYYSEAVEAQSTLTKIEIDDLGQLSQWPENFMGDAFGETLAAEKARLKRLSAK
jgi:predicted ATPase